MKVAIFGGSFNPPHLGHLNSARYAADQLKPDVFLIIPDIRTVNPKPTGMPSIPAVKPIMTVKIINRATIELLSIPIDIMTPICGVIVLMI